MQYISRLVRLVFGLFLFALGCVLTMRGNVGYGPWELFHTGLTHLLPLTIGQITVLTGVVIVVIDALLRESIGLGTLANMILVGTFMDLILATQLLPLAKGWIDGLALLVLGLFVTATGSYFYISAGFGAGPRDSLMVAIRRFTGLPIGAARSALEFTAAALGFLLCGPLGLGTVLCAVGLGSCVQIVFRLFHFEATAIHHENLVDTWRLLSKRTPTAK